MSSDAINHVDAEVLQQRVTELATTAYVKPEVSSPPAPELADYEFGGVYKIGCYLLHVGYSVIVGDCNPADLPARHPEFRQTNVELTCGIRAPNGNTLIVAEVVEIVPQGPYNYAIRREASDVNGTRLVAPHLETMTLTQRQRLAEEYEALNDLQYAGLMLSDELDELGYSEGPLLLSRRSVIRADYDRIMGLLKEAGEDNESLLDRMPLGIDGLFYAQS